MIQAIANQLILMKNDGDSFELLARENSVLLLSAAPQRTDRGARSFVMNTRAELIQAFEDFRMANLAFWKSNILSQQKVLNEGVPTCSVEFSCPARTFSRVQKYSLRHFGKYSNILGRAPPDSSCLILS
ncbi:MAG: pirin-like C-terminal cupin domain-containing protein [Saprospiraceae bacterium]